MVVEQRAEWWVAIGHAFAAHVREEVAILQSYEQLLASTTDPGTQYVLRLILDDERRHHDLFEQLEAAARADETRAAATVGPPTPPAAEREPLMAATERFLAIERDDQASLHRLRRELKPAADDTLWHLLVELIELDTQKHIRILEYLRKRLRSLG